jgi:hypothetical protein
MPSQHAVAHAISRFVAAGYPNIPSEEVIELTIEGWSEDLADLTDAELADACRAYRRSIDPADRWWPTPGRILALSPLGRVAAQLGSTSEVDLAWTDFNERMQALAGFGGPRIEDEKYHLDADPHRNEAMFEALHAFGGFRAWQMATVEDRSGPARWRATYAEARRRQAADLSAVRAMLAGPAVRALLPGDRS